MKSLLFKLTVLLVALGACSQPALEPDLALEPTIQTPGGRPEVPLSQLPEKRVMVAVVFGQSNAGNAGESALNPGPGVYSFFNGKLYAGFDPLPGSTGNRGSVWTRLARKLVARGKYDAVVLVPIGIASKRMTHWAPGGYLNSRLLREIRGLKSRGLSPTHLLWVHGETDAAVGTSKSSYMSSFYKMLASVRKEGVDAPIYVSVTTKVGWRGPDKTIRSAQIDLVDKSKGVYSGPDTDALGSEYRYGKHHFNNRGLEVFADLWLEKLGVKVGDLPETKPGTADRYVVDFQGVPTGTLIRSVKVGSGVDYKGSKNPKNSTVSVVAQPWLGGRMWRGRQAKIVNVYGSKRLTVIGPRTNDPSPQGGRIRLGFAAFNRGGVKITSLTLSNITTSGAYMQFFYAGGGASRRYQLVPTGPDKSTVLPADIARVRAVDIVAQNAFAVDDVAFSDGN